MLDVLSASLEPSSDDRVASLGPHQVLGIRKQSPILALLLSLTASASSKPSNRLCPPFWKGIPDAQALPVGLYDHCAALHLPTFLLTISGSSNAPVNSL
jgi:hypothetical protein